MFRADRINSQQSTSIVNELFQEMWCSRLFMLLLLLSHKRSSSRLVKERIQDRNRPQKHNRDVGLTTIVGRNQRRVVLSREGRFDLRV